MKLFLSTDVEMFSVRFDLIVTSVKEFTIEVNKLDLMNPIQADGIEG